MGFSANFGANGSIKSGELLASGEIALTNFSIAMEYWRWKLRNKIERLLPSDARYAGVIIALVMGDQNAIDQNDWQIFNATGVGHLISITKLIGTYLNIERNQTVTDSGFRFNLSCLLAIFNGQF